MKIVPILRLSFFGIKLQTGESCRSAVTSHAGYNFISIVSSVLQKFLPALVSTKRSSNCKQFVLACYSAKMRSYISLHSRCLLERYAYYPRSLFFFSSRRSLHTFFAFPISPRVFLLPLILPVPIDHLPHRNFTSRGNHVCLTAFFAFAKLFRAATRTAVRDNVIALFGCTCTSCVRV